jgi:hypothetical protein
MGNARLHEARIEDEMVEDEPAAVPELASNLPHRPQLVVIGQEVPDRVEREDDEIRGRFEDEVAEVGLNQRRRPDAGPGPVCGRAPGLRWMNQPVMGLPCFATRYRCARFNSEPATDPGTLRAFT